MRAEMQHGFAVTNAKIGTLAGGMVSVNKRLDDLQPFECRAGKAGCVAN